jgi:putative endopeptidase
MFRNKLQQVTKKHYKYYITKKVITKKQKNKIIVPTNNELPQCNEIMMPIYSFEKKYEINELKSKQLKHQTRFIDYYNKKKRFAPTNDYYNYVNSDWIEKMTLMTTQKHLTKIDTYRLIQDKVFNEINDIYKNLINLNSTKKEVVNMKEFYISAQNLLTKEQCKTYINKFIIYLDNLRNQPIKNNLWKLLSFISKNKMISEDAPLYFNMSPNEKNTNKYCVHIASITVPTLSTIKMYIDNNNPKYKEINNKYLEYIQKYLDLTLDNNTLKSTDVHSVLKDIFLCFSTTNFNNDSNGYNKVNKDESLEKYRFNFEEYCKELGFLVIPDYFIVSNLDYLKNVSELMLRDWKTDKWRTYWIGIFVKQIIRFTKDYKNISDDFYLKFLKGQESDFSDEIRAIRLTLLPYNKMLSDLYIEKYNNSTLINYLTNITIDIKQVFYKMIQTNKWLEDKTKKTALLKLDHLKIIVGESPDQINDPDINYISYDVWHNLVSYNEWKMLEYLKLNEKDVKHHPIIKWSEYPFEYVGSQPFIVNANYTSTTNSIYIPSAYIQEPFISLQSDSSIDYNLANIGFTIAHELSHSLDNVGANYDYNGNLNDWWSPSDKKKYKEIQNNVKKHYEFVAKKDGIHFDSELTLRENISDINGIAICTRYMIDFLHSSNIEMSSFKEVFEDFYIYYAIQMRQKINKNSVNYYNETNPHPMDKYRVNVPLSRCECFQSLYNIKKGDGMYYSPIMSIF